MPYCKYFTEDQIYRIDHYAGKETVQNLMVVGLPTAYLNRYGITGLLIMWKFPCWKRQRQGPYKFL